MLEPLLCFLAILVFVIALLVGCALSFVWPAIALVLAVAAFATWHPFLGVKILQQALKSLGGAFVVLGETAAALWHPLRPIRTVLPLPPPLPNLSRLAADVAEQMGQPPFDGVLISPEANFGVFEVPRKGAGPARYLVAGTPLLFVFTVDELRAVIAHEVAHLALVTVQVLPIAEGSTGRSDRDLSSVWPRKRAAKMPTRGSPRLNVSSPRATRGTRPSSTRSPS